jgi:predicted metal-dependent peptidase
MSVAALKPCALTPAERKLWDDTRAALLWTCPAFTHILYTMMAPNTGTKDSALFTEDVPIAATDGFNLLLNPKTFFKYNLSERVFVCAHEIMHCIWNHCGLMHQFAKRGKISYPNGKDIPYNQQLMNVAADLVINDALIESKVGQFNKDWLHDRDIGTSKDSALDVYAKIYKESGGGGRGGTGGSGQKGTSFDEHLPPGTSQGKDATSAAAGRNETQWASEVASAMHSAKVAGKLPGALERLFGEILNPAVDWKDKIQALFARKLGAGSYDWLKPDRRLISRDIYAPGRSGYGAGTVVVGCDTSGSIGPKELDMFFGEMAGILEDVRPRRLVVIWCDARVGRVDEVEDAAELNVVRHKGAPGGGGTSFVPVFDEIAKMGIEPDALVYLTDGYGTFPAKAPPYTVIWGNISAPDAVKYPFGDVVDVPVQAA